MREPTSHAHNPAGKPEESRRSARGKASCATAPATVGHCSAQRQAFLDLIRALAIAAARADHDAEQDRVAG